MTLTIARKMELISIFATMIQIIWFSSMDRRGLLTQGDSSEIMVDGVGTPESTKTQLALQLKNIGDLGQIGSLVRSTVSTLIFLERTIALRSSVTQTPLVMICLETLSVAAMMDFLVTAILVRHG